MHESVSGLIHIGFGNYLPTCRIVAIGGPKSAPIKRQIQDAKDNGKAIDLTNGRRTKAVVYTDSDHLVLSALEPVTIDGRIREANKL